MNRVGEYLKVRDALIADKLVNWWAHDSLHLHNGMDLSGLLRIEYAFHMTLIAAGLTLAWFFLSVARTPTPAAR